MIERLKSYFKSLDINFKDNMVIKNGAPHTAPVAHLTSCCPGDFSAKYYFAGRYFDEIDDSLAQGIISELKKFQDTDKASDTYGCLKWYREESFVIDTNAAFFILLPVSLTLLFCSHKMSDYEKDTIKEMLKHAGIWFTKQCSGALFYSNKIMSDGAMLSLISCLTGKYTKECESFWYRWLDYAERRGWGWGENTSDDYSQVMLDALNVVVLTINNDEIKKMITDKRQELLDYIAFHGGKEFVPSIRCYNFKGDVNYVGLIYRILHNPDITLHLLPAAILLYNAGIKKIKFNIDGKNESKCERMFDDCYAYTWRGDGIRLGSVTRFPVMPKSYQSEKHGLGWQSMPVSAMIEGEEISFLKLKTVVNKNVHSHPTEGSFNSGYLSTRLFEDKNIPDYSIRCAQKDNIVIAVREIVHIANCAEALYDEWSIPGEAEVEKIAANGYEWYVYKRDNRGIAVCPLKGIGVEDNCRKQQAVKVVKTENFTNISKALYEGESKYLCKYYTESAWVIVALDTAEDCEEYLNKISITDTDLEDFDIPRPDGMLPRCIKCTDGKSDVSLKIDPYEPKL